MTAFVSELQKRATAVAGWMTTTNVIDLMHIMEIMEISFEDNCSSVTCESNVATMCQQCENHNRQHLG